MNEKDEKKQTESAEPQIPTVITFTDKEKNDKK